MIHDPLAEIATAADVSLDAPVAAQLVPAELARPHDTGVTLIHPDTGETVDVSTADTDWLVRYHADVDAWVRRAQAARRIADDELLRRMDRDNAHTIHAAGYKASAPATDYAERVDGARLRDLLAPFVEAGDITQRAVDDAVERVETVAYKVNAAKVNGLRKRAPAISDAVLAAVVREPKTRSVSVR